MGNNKEIFPDGKQVYLSTTELMLIMPLIENKYKNTKEGTLTHHELGHLIEKLK